ncbi:MAG: hypothetical protein QW175_04740 [Candidatus Bathyarchaeia archaeon]
MMENEKAKKAEKKTPEEAWKEQWTKDSAMATFNALVDLQRQIYALQQQLLIVAPWLKALKE